MLAGSIADNQILNIVLNLKKKLPKREVILVSKDINIRIKGRALGIVVQDYFNDKVMGDTELFIQGIKSFQKTSGKSIVRQWNHGKRKDECFIAHRSLMQ